jgi:hypothetical protein
MRNDAAGGGANHLQDHGAWGYLQGLLGWDSYCWPQYFGPIWYK